MLKLPILQSPDLAVKVILLPFHLLLFLDELFHGLGKYFLMTVFWQQGLAKWWAALDFYINEGKVTENAQKLYFQVQHIRNEITKCQKVLANIVGPV